jgi:hypothetical protein
MMESIEEGIKQCTVPSPQRVPPSWRDMWALAAISCLMTESIEEGIKQCTVPSHSIDGGEFIEQLGDC